MTWNDVYCILFTRMRLTRKGVRIKRAFDLLGYSSISPTWAYGITATHWDYMAGRISYALETRSEDAAKEIIALARECSTDDFASALNVRGRR